MNLQLTDNKVERLEFFKKKDSNLLEKQFTLKYNSLFDPEDRKTFRVIFNITVDIANKLQLEIEYASTFITDEDITDEFKKSNFPIVNAPAISFPFLRSFIATFVLNAGYGPVLLPSINFTSLEKEKNSKK